MEETRVSKWPLAFKWIMRFLVVLVIGAILGFAFGHRTQHMLEKKAPSAPSVIAALAKPLPIPQGTKLLKEIHGGHGGGNGTVTWRHRVVLDVSGMNQEQVEGIPEFYKAYLTSQIPELSSTVGLGWGSVDTEWDTQGLFKDGDGSYSTAYGANWSWRRRTRSIGENLFCDVYAEVADFDVDHANSSQGSVWYVHKPVMELRTPVQGQRVMYVCLTFVGNGLSGPVAWPAK